MTELKVVIPRTQFTVSVDGEYDPDDTNQVNDIIDQIIASINDCGIEFSLLEE